MKTYRVYQVDAFTREKFRGNPAGVVSNAGGLTEAQMQAIARELNNSETAFILPPRDDSHDVWVRFFTPSREVPVCGHATVSAHFVRAMELGLENAAVRQLTGAGVQTVRVSSGSAPVITITQSTPGVEPPLPASVVRRIAAALGVRESDLRPDCPVCIATTGHSKVMVALRDVELLHSLQPDQTALAGISRDIGCNGFYVFTLHPREPALVHARMFAPAIGIAEDPVTGNGGGPVGAYLVRWGHLKGDEVRFVAVQGEAIGRTGSMEVRVLSEQGVPTQVQISGSAVLAFQTEIQL